MKTSDILFPNVYKENREMLDGLKKELCVQNATETWALCLGAGVSMSAGLPNWYELLAKITARLIPLELSSLDFLDKDKSKDNKESDESGYYTDLRDFKLGLADNNAFFESLNKAILDGADKDVFSNINVLEAAEYILNNLRHNIEDVNALGQTEKEERILHWDINYLVQEACKNREVITKENNTLIYSTLGAVARLMKSDKDSLVHNVITYNYDNLLETYLREISGCPASKVHSIIKKDELRDFAAEDEWSVYHAHGRIPVVEFAGEGMSEEIILTESDYYKEESVNYSWTNILQSYAITRANMIFIGFSGMDYNFRRIIKYVSREKMAVHKHKRYIFYLVDDIVKAVFREAEKVDKCIEEMNKPDGPYLYKKLFINYMLHSQSEYWSKYGMTVIWSSREELYVDLDYLHL